MSDDVVALLADLFVARGVPDHIRSDNGPEFVAHAVRDWLGSRGVKTLYIEPGSPWENGYRESFNGKLGDELLKVEIFYTLLEAQVLIERCGAITTPTGLTVPWATGLRRRSPSCQDRPVINSKSRLT